MLKKLLLTFNIILFYFLSVSVLKADQGKDVKSKTSTKSISILISSKMSSIFKMLHQLLLLIIKNPMKCDFIDNKSEKKHLRDDNSMNRGPSTQRRSTEGLWQSNFISTDLLN